LVELVAPRGNAALMTGLSDVLQLRVRYSETDQMGTFYNSRALEWFECGRTELMRRRLGMSYTALEARGVFLPLVEAHLEFQGRARYDDLLEIASTVNVSGRAKLRFDVQIHQGESRKPVVRGYTVHAFTDRRGKPIRPPAWFVAALQEPSSSVVPIGSSYGDTPGVLRQSALPAVHEKPCSVGH
jgi:acyl-CoA thioester hydrolase